MWFRLLLTIILAMSVTGCVSTRTQVKDSQVQQLQMQVSKLKDELQQKNDEIDYLEEQLQEARSRRPAALEEKKTKGNNSLMTPSRKPAALEGKKTKGNNSLMTPKDIQAALKKAGFYKGAIDGKIETGTKKAIKEFQKSNGLVANGIAGEKTRLKLKKYLK